MFDIHKLELTNFKSFSGTFALEFPKEPGIYYLTGRNKDNPRLGANGVGKSTLLDAVYWCLYGRTTRGLKAGDVVNWDEKGCGVTVWLTVGDQHLEVQRSQNPNSLTLNGTTVDQTTLETALRLSPQAFSYSVQMPQFGEPFFSLAPAAKMQLFSDIMGLEYWLDKSREAATLAAEILNQRRQEEVALARSQGQLSQIEADITGASGRHKNYVEQQTTLIKGLQGNLKTATTRLDQAKKALTQTQNLLEACATRLVAFDKKLNQADSFCKECRQPLPSPEADKVLADIRAVEQNQRDFERECSHHERAHNMASSEVAALKKQIETEQARKNPYADMITEKEMKATICKNQIAQAELALKQLDEDHAAVSFWVGGFKRIRLMLVEQTLRSLEIEVNNNLASVGLLDWRVEFDVERENKSGGVTKGFVVMVYPPGRDKPVRLEAWSGGELQRLAMAGDLGLANLIMERAGLINSIEFYDELSTHLSDEGVQDVLETLHTRAHTLQRRIWVVDHRVLEYDGFNATLTVAKDAKSSQLIWGAPAA